MFALGFRDKSLRDVSNVPPSITVLTNNTPNISAGVASITPHFPFLSVLYPAFLPYPLPRFTLCILLRVTVAKRPVDMLTNHQTHKYKQRYFRSRSPTPITPAAQQTRHVAPESTHRALYNNFRMLQTLIFRPIKYCLPSCVTAVETRA